MLTKVLLTFIATIFLYYTYKLLFGKCNRFNVCRIILLTMSVFAFVFPFISIKISGQMPEYFFIMDNLDVLSNNEIITAYIKTENVRVDGVKIEIIIATILSVVCVVLATILTIYIRKNKSKMR